MRGFGSRSIGHKLIILFCAVSALSVGLAFSAFLAYDAAHYRSTLEREIAIVAEFMARTIAPSLSRGTAPATSASTPSSVPAAAPATQPPLVLPSVLTVLRAEPRIASACLYDRGRATLAVYVRDGKPLGCPRGPGPERSFRFTLGELDVLYPVTASRELRAQSPLVPEYLGELFFRINLTGFYVQMLLDLAIGVLVMGVILLVVFALSKRLQRVISNPIRYLTQVAGRVSAEGDYAIRAIQWSEDEVGLLTRQFNRMLEQIQHRDGELRQVRSGLETRVERRTRDLRNEIAERKVIERELRDAKRLAEEANRAKSEFLANMSHELRTPLNAVIGYGEMLEEDAVATGQLLMVPDLKHIQTAGRKLLTLISDILDLSKIEAGRCEVHMEWVPVAAIVDEVLEVIQPLARWNRNRFTVAVDPRLDLVYVDPMKFHQCLLNLLSNACKFTQDGTIALAVEPGAAAPTPNPHKDPHKDRHQDRLEDPTDALPGHPIAAVDWHVRDTGIGIDPGEAHRLFQAFSQLDGSATRAHGGTGLGLAISQRLCQLMGGSIAVDSVPGQGSTFTIHLPAPAHAPATAATVESAAVESAAVESAGLLPIVSA